MLWHFAYTFNSQKAHQDLLEKILIDDKIDVYQIQAVAKSIINNADEKLQRRLDSLRYDDDWLDDPDDDWLDDPDDDASQAYLWYMIYLFTYFHDAPSLSNN